MTCKWYNRHAHLLDEMGIMKTQSFLPYGKYITETFIKLNGNIMIKTHLLNEISTIETYIYLMIWGIMVTNIYLMKWI